jgi:hypothetical protein
MSDKKLFTASALILLLFSLISPANANWAMFHADLNRTGVAAEDWSPGSVTWNFATGAPLEPHPQYWRHSLHHLYDDYVTRSTASRSKVWSTKAAATSTPHQSSQTAYLHCFTGPKILCIKRFNWLRDLEQILRKRLPYLFSGSIRWNGVFWGRRRLHLRIKRR